MTAVRVSLRSRIDMGVDPSSARPKCDYCRAALKGWGWEHKGNLVCRGCYSDVAVCQIDGCPLDGDPTEASVTVVARDAHGTFLYKTASMILCFAHSETR